MKKRFIATISLLKKGIIRVTVFDKKYSNPLHDYETPSELKDFAIKNLTALYGKEIYFLDQTVQPMPPGK